MTEKKIGYNDAYSLKTPGDSIKLYKKWAQTYDQDFAFKSNYLSPNKICNYYNKYARITDTPILDVGAGTGLVGECLNKTGNKKIIGIGNIFNAPIAAGTEGKVFIKIFEEKILRNIDKFKPEIILISAGFDAHKRDPLAHINLESENYNEITKKIVEIANIHSQGRVISFLEGGYDLFALSESIKEHLIGLKDS